MITIHGPNGMKATVLAYSITQAGKKLITWEIEYPRLILAELNTHRQLSRNSYSSRAVPFLKMLDQLTGEPVRFGANQAGMQDAGVDFDADVIMRDGYGTFSLKPREAWKAVRNVVIELARPFYEAGYHKQVYNRLLEAFQMQKSVVSATEVDNFFWLRDDDAADPTLHALAKIMREAMESVAPELLMPGEWHLPYLDITRDPVTNIRGYCITGLGQIETIPVTLEEAIKISCARCAAVSYRNEGYGVAKSLEVYDRLVGGDRKHASAFEHCATPMFINTEWTMTVSSGMNVPMFPESWEPGVTHMDRKKNLWSGNFQGWVQYRKLISGECYTAE